MKNLIIAIILFDTLNKIIEVDEWYNLCKNIFTIIHAVTYAETTGLKIKSLEIVWNQNQMKPLSNNIFKELYIKTLGR